MKRTETSAWVISGHVPATGQRPRFDQIKHYYRKERTWEYEIDQRDGYELFTHKFPDDLDGILPGIYTHVSAAWIEDPGCWVILYSEAWNERNLYEEPIVARFSADLVNWSDRVEIFHPIHDRAYGRYTHKPGVDRIHPDQPPSNPAGPDKKGWAYGAFIVEKFTKWNEAERILRLTYLMSTASPYQVHMMETDVRLPDPIT